MLPFFVLRHQHSNIRLYQHSVPNWNRVMNHIMNHIVSPR